MLPLPKIGWGIWGNLFSLAPGDPNKDGSIDPRRENIPIRQRAVGLKEASQNMTTNEDQLTWSAKRSMGMANSVEANEQLSALAGMKPTQRPTRHP